MKKIKIRLGNISDLKELEILQIDMENTIEDEPYPDELGKEGLKFILQNPEQGFYIVAEYNRKVIGALRISFERSVSRNGFFWWIQNVCVEKKYRGNQVFQKLFNEVIKLAKKSDNVVAVKLHVHTNNKSALFPSIALSWFASKEDFLKKYGYLTELKFRISYGKIGSNPISPYQSLALMMPIRYNFNDEIITGFFESNLANDDLSWETTDQFNFGIDIALLDSKLSLTIDLYHKLTSDLLQNVQLPVSNGYISRVDNFGEVENRGVDFSIESKILEKSDFIWNLNTNFGLNKNKLNKLNSNLDFQLGPFIGFSQAYPILFRVGQPLGIYWGAQTNGIYANWDEAIDSGIAGAAPGEIKYVNNYVDLDDSGQPLAIQEINFDDYVKIGDPNPDFTYSISNNFSYKNWDATLLFTGQKGGDLFWVDSWQLSGLQKTTNVLASSFNNSWKAPLFYENGNYLYDPSIGNLNNATHPGAIIDPGKRAIPSDRNIYDGSFLRLKNINVGYNFNFSEGRKMRLYIAGQNLIVWTKYPGYDPEVRTYTKNPQKRGVDFGTYPGTKTFLVGLKFNY